MPRAQAELDYYMFWATVYHSKLPYFKSQAKFIQDTIRIYDWKVGWQTETSVQVIKCYSGSCRVEDCTFQLQPVVAPRLPSLGSQLGPDLKLRPAERSALVTAVGTPEALKVCGICCHPVPGACSFVSAVGMPQFLLLWPQMACCSSFIVAAYRLQ